MSHRTGYLSLGPVRDLSRWGRRYQVDVDYLKPEAGDPQNESGQGCLVGQLGAKGCCAWAYGDLAIIEFRAQCGARLTGKRDLICLKSHQSYPSWSGG